MDFSVVGITPEIIAYVWSWGFASVAGSYLIGYVVSIGKRLIGMV